MRCCKNFYPLVLVIDLPVSPTLFENLNLLEIKNEEQVNTIYQKCLATARIRGKSKCYYIVIECFDRILS